MIYDLLVCVGIYFIVFFPKWKKEDFLTFLLKTIYFIYLSGVFYETLSPLIFNILHFNTHKIHQFNFNPFVDIIEQHNSAVEDVLLNIVMFIPFGVLYPLVHKEKFKETVANAFVISLCIEAIQPVLSEIRAGDITDVITNTLGALIGYSIYHTFKKRMEKLSNK